MLQSVVQPVSQSTQGEIVIGLNQDNDIQRLPYLVQMNYLIL